MPLPDIPVDPVDGSFIETQWGIDVARLLRLLGNAPDGPNQIGYYPTDRTWAALSAPAVLSQLLNGPGGLSWREFVATAVWAQDGAAERIPVDRQTPQLDIQSGSVLPGAGESGQWLMLNVPASRAADQTIGKTTSGVGTGDPLRGVNPGWGIAAAGNTVVVDGRFGAGLRPRYWSVTTGAYTYAQTSTSLAQNPSADVSPGFVASLARAGQRGYLSGEDGWAWRFDIDGTGNWSARSVQSAQLGVADRGISMDSDGTRLYYVVDSMNNAGSIAGTEAAVRSVDLSFNGDRAEVTVAVTNVVGLAVSDTRIYLLDMVDQGEPSTSSTGSADAVCDLIEIVKGTGEELGRIPVRFSQVWKTQASDAETRGVPQAGWDLTADTVGGVDQVYTIYRNSNLSAAHGRVSAEGGVQTYNLRRISLTPGEVHTPGFVVYQRNAANTEWRFVADITRNILETIQAAAGGTFGVQLAEVQALLADWDSVGGGQPLPVARAQDVIQAAVDRVGPVTGRTEAEVDQQIDDKVPAVFRAGNTDRIEAGKSLGTTVTGGRLDTQGRLVLDKIVGAPDTITLPSGDGGGTGGDREVVNELIAAALRDVRTAIGTNAGNITSLTDVVTAVREGLASLEGRYDVLEPDPSTIDANERYLAATLRGGNVITYWDLSRQVPIAGRTGHVLTKTGENDTDYAFRAVPAVDADAVRTAVDAEVAEYFRLNPTTIADDSITPGKLLADEAAQQAAFRARIAAAAQADLTTVTVNLRQAQIDLGTVRTAAADAQTTATTALGRTRRLRPISTWLRQDRTAQTIYLHWIPGVAVANGASVAVSVGGVSISVRTNEALAAGDAAGTILTVPVTADNAGTISASATVVAGRLEVQVDFERVIDTCWVAAVDPPAAAPKAARVLQAPVAATTAAGVTTLTLPANYATWKEMHIAVFTTPADIAETTYDTALMAVQTSTQRYLVASDQDGNSHWFTFNPTSRAVAALDEGGARRIIYCALQD